MRYPYEISPSSLILAITTFLISKILVLWVIHKRLPNTRKVREIAYVWAGLFSPTILTAAWIIKPDDVSTTRLLFLPIFAWFVDVAVVQYLNAIFEPVLPEDHVGESDIDASNAGNYFLD